MSGEVPEGWRSGRIADLVAEVTVRIDPQAVADPDTPYIGLEDIGQGTGTIISVGRASEATSQKSGFLAGDILFGKLRPNLKKVARPDFGGICSTDIVVFRAKAKVDPDFAFRALSSGPVIDHAVAQAAGTKMPRAHARSVLNFETILPPLDEQRRIAEVLRSVDEVASSNALAHNKARAFLNVAQNDIAASHSVTRRLGDVCHVVGGYAFKSETFSDAGIKVLRISNITDAGVQFGERAAHVGESDLVGLDRFLLKEGDTLIALSGATTGKMCVFDSYERAYVNQRVAYIRVKYPSETSQSFVNHAMAALVEKIRQSAYGGAQPNISTKDISDIHIPMPTFIEQTSVSEALNGAQSVVASCGAVSDVVDDIKKRVAADLLSGRVRVPA